MEPEKFDPKNFTYDELPEEHRGDFTPVEGGGFVRNEAIQALTDAEALAKIASMVEGKDITPVDVLHGEANAKQEEDAATLMKIRGVVKYNENYNYKEENVKKYLDSLPDELFERKNFVIEAVRGRGKEAYTHLIMNRVPEVLRGDKEFMLEVASVCGLIESASEELRGDKEVILTAMGNNARAVYSATEEVKADKEVAMLAARRGMGIPAESLQGDKELGLIAVRANGRMLQGLSEELRGDKDIVLEAVRSSNGWSLQYASEELRGDKDVVMAAVKSGEFKFGSYGVHISKEMQEDEDIALEIVRVGKREGPKAYGFSGSFEDYFTNVSGTLKQDKGFIEKAMQINPDVLLYAAKELREDRELAQAYLRVSASSTNGGWQLVLNYFPDSIREDREFMLDAMRNGVKPINLLGMSDKLKGDLTFIAEAVSINPDAIKVASDEIRKKVTGR